MLHTSTSPLPGNVRELSSVELNGRLADALALHSALKTAHWNVRGASAYELHKLFDELAAKQLGRGDKLAERVVTLGGLAQASPSLIAATSPLASYPLTLTDGAGHVEALINHYRTFVARLHASLDTCKSDRITAQMLEAMIEDVEHDGMFLTAQLS